FFVFLRFLDFFSHDRSFPNLVQNGALALFPLPPVCPALDVEFTARQAVHNGSSSGFRPGMAKWRPPKMKRIHCLGRLEQTRWKRQKMPIIPICLELSSQSVESLQIAKSIRASSASGFRLLPST